VERHGRRLSGVRPNRIPSFAPGAGGPAAMTLDAQGHPVIHDGCVGCGVCVRACVTSPSSLTLSLVES